MQIQANSNSNGNDDANGSAVTKGIQSADPDYILALEISQGGAGWTGNTSLDDSNWAPILALNATYTYSPTYAEVRHGYNQSKMPVFVV